MDTRKVVFPASVFTGKNPKKKELTLMYIRSGNSVKPDTFIIKLKDKELLELVYMEANYHTWVASHTVSHWDVFEEFLESIGVEKEDYYVACVFLFYFVYVPFYWATRDKVLYPSHFEGKSCAFLLFLFLFNTFFQIYHVCLRSGLMKLLESGVILTKGVKNHLNQIFRKFD